MKTHNRHLIILVTLAALLLGLENWGWGQKVWPGDGHYLSSGTFTLTAQPGGGFKASYNWSPYNDDTDYDYIGNIYVNNTNSKDSVKIVFKYETADTPPIKFNGYVSYVNFISGQGTPLILSVDAPATRTKPTVERYSGYTRHFIYMPVHRHPKSLTIKSENTTTPAKFIIDGGSKGLTPSIASTNYTAIHPDGGIDAKCPLFHICCGTITMTDVTLQNNYNIATSSTSSNSNDYSLYNTTCCRASGILFECVSDNAALSCTMSNCKILNCFSKKEGAALSIHTKTSDSYVRMTGCSVENCVAEGNTDDSGGIVRIGVGTNSAGASTNVCSLTATHCTFSGNYNNGASGGGAIYWPNNTNAATKLLTLEDCTITGNHGLKYGGGVYCKYAVMKDCTITGNEVRVVDNTFDFLVNEAGGVFADTKLTLSGTMVIKDNTAMLIEGSSVIQGPKPSDVCFNYYDATAFVTIGEEGLNCGSCIGIFKFRGTGQNFYEDFNTGENPYDVCKIAEGTGTNAAANCLYAYRNHIFFDDDDLCHVFNEHSISGDQHYYNNTTETNLFFVRKEYAKNDINSWHDQTASAETDYVLTDEYVSEVKTAAGLAYFSKDVLTHDYTGKTVTLSNDISLAGHNWEPIGCRDCNSITSKVFKGTFDGQGHTISGLTCPYPYYNVGLFGAVGDNGIVKNTFVEVGSLSSSSNVDNLGGLVADLQSGGKVINCAANVTSVSGASTTGGLVGNNAGTVANCYVNTSISNSLVGANAGTVENCYVRGTTNKVGSGTAAVNCYASTDGSDGDYTAVNYTYGERNNMVRGTSDPLVKTLNNWVDAQGGSTYASWARPTTTTINGGYPILKMADYNAVAVNSGTPEILHYGDINTLIGSYKLASNAIYLYRSATSVATNVGEGYNAKLYIDEDAAITQAVTTETTGIDAITAYVGVTLKNTQSSAISWDWHMFSSALTAAPLSVTYPDNSQVAFGVAPTFTFNTSGYLPCIPTSPTNLTGEWDYYCYFEPQYHWINLKRNGNSHWHEDAPNGTHEKIRYKATPTATECENETNLVPGKGYLFAAKQETFLQCEGTLNNADVSIAVTTDGDFRKGYNFIGNPYQSYYDFNEFAVDNKALWGGDVTKASYMLLSGNIYTSYTYNASENKLAAPRCLHPHQGFMIVATNAGTATFDNDNRYTDGHSAFRDEQPHYPLVNLIATDGDGKSDITTVELGRPDKGGAVKAYDLHLGKGCLYTRYEGGDYAIAFTQPGITEVGIRFEADEEATFTMTWDIENGEFGYLHLIDNITGTDTDCLSATEYHFSATPDDYQSRFKLVFYYTGIEEPEVPEPVEGPTTFAFQMGDQLVVNGEGVMRVFDMTGRMMMERSVNGAQTTIALPDLPSGVYALQLKGANGTQTQKIVIKR